MGRGVRPAFPSLSQHPRDDPPRNFWIGCPADNQSRRVLRGDELQAPSHLTLPPVHSQRRHAVVCKAFDQTAHRETCLHASNSLCIKHFTNGYLDRISTAKYAYPLCQRMRGVEEFEPLLATALTCTIARATERR